MKNDFIAQLRELAAFTRSVAQDGRRHNAEALQTIEKTRIVIQQTLESIRRSDQISEGTGYRTAPISVVQHDCT